MLKNPDRIAVYDTADVFSAMNTAHGGKSTLPDGYKFRRNSGRLVLFKAKGVACVKCGVEGSVFALERESGTQNPYHLNLYAITADGWILMTKDHILPKSLGGANSLENYDTMCSPCNAKKGNKV